MMVFLEFGGVGHAIQDIRKLFVSVLARIKYMGIAARSITGDYAQYKFRIAVSPLDEPWQSGSGRDADSTVSRCAVRSRG
ncbi:hypothetical protein [Burkholderia pseudomallei]|nr:hypothetical protein [Burkholderia pseudomallei]PNW99787.1 hypothetical protein CF640_00385 [Burkholderia pseudomallei]PNX23814.1 hypothetical protein CF645_03955 [Burkholderia pseudomallei]